MISVWTLLTPLSCRQRCAALSLIPTCFLSLEVCDVPSRGLCCDHCSYGVALSQWLSSNELQIIPLLSDDLILGLMDLEFQQRRRFK